MPEILAQAIEIFGVVSGLVYVCLEIKYCKAMWWVGIVMALCYIAVFAHGALYASMGLYVYYLIISIYGLFSWGRKTNGGETPIRHGKSGEILLSAGLLLSLQPCIWQILLHCTDHPAPFADACISALNIVATWLLARSVIEQWWLVAAANLIAVALYLHRQLYPTAFLFAVYFICSLAGYRRWKKELEKNAEARERRG